MQIRSTLRRDVGGAGTGASPDLPAPSTATDPVPVEAGVEAGRFTTPNPLFEGCPSLFLQTACGSGKLGPAATLAVVEGTGLLLTLNSRATKLPKALRAAVGECRSIVAATLNTSDDANLDGVVEIGGVGGNSTVPAILADANRYSGKNRSVATGTGPNLDPAWIAVQRELGLPVALTDSPYVRGGDNAGLVAVLEETRAFGPGVVAVLALHIDWFKKDATRLAASINNVGVPVAIALEHADDPLGVHDAVAGLVHLLTHAQVNVALLRSDVSVIGAIAFGASFGAIGTTTGLRHVYPVKEKSSGFNNGSRIGTFVPRGMVYRALDTLNTAIGADEEHPERWICNCRHCYNRPLSSIHDEVGAYEHALSSIADLCGFVLNAPTALHRQHAWVGRCLHAQTTNFEIASETGLNWDPPKFQAAWHKLAPTLAPLPPLPQT